MNGIIDARTQSLRRLNSRRLRARCQRIRRGTIHRAVILGGVACAFAFPAVFACAQPSRRTSLGLKMLPWLASKRALDRPDTRVVHRREVLPLRVPALRAKPKGRDTPLRMTPTHL